MTRSGPKRRRLTTPRLVLRPFSMDDLPALHALTGHPDVWRYDPGWERSLEETRELLAFRVQEYQRHGFGRLAVVDRSSAQLVGYCGLQLGLVRQGAFAVPEMQLFYGLGREWWGRGLMTEACQCLVDHAFAELHVPSVCACAAVANDRSVNVMRRLGMTVQADLADRRWLVGRLAHPQATGSESARA